MVETNILLDTINQVVTLNDGIAEYSDKQILEVLLPKKIATVLGVAEEVSFTTLADVKNSYFVSYNSEIFDNLESLLQDTGYVAGLGIKYHGHLKQSGFEKMIAETFFPQNGLIKFVKAYPEVTPYILFNVAYTAESDETRKGIVSFFVNGITGVSGINIGDALSWKSDRIAMPSDEEKLSLNYENLLNISQQVASEYIEEQIKPWRNSLSRKLKRDSERIEDYYQTIISEIITKIKKKNLEGDAEKKELDRINATKMELKRKLTDIEQKYSLNITASLHSSLIIWLETVHIECQLIRKKNKRNIIAIWNPYTKIIEPLRCEKSNLSVTSFFLSDDDNVQIVNDTNCK
ncbi:hypothetical protein ACN4EE_18025 [Geminocystis sp. CENA526]|uniref:hypothetical protein n=1 Tax=Geminocystis sp. CENA526 TaxID=1355871 RepID=UPI003D6E2083